MTQYKHLFFDFDDTLIDFKAAERVALPKVFEEYSCPFTPEIEMYYTALNESLWKALEAGTITREQLMERRFAETMANAGVTVDGKKMDKRYRTLLGETIILIDGAEALIQELANTYELYIVTNGMKETQMQRLQASGLSKYFKHIFVSEETGFQKPQNGFFEYVFARIPQLNLEQSLIIGDSFSADIIGGYNVGIDTCWFNHQHRVNNTSIKPTYMIERLTQLNIILNGE